MDRPPPSTGLAETMAQTGHGSGSEPTENPLSNQAVTEEYFVLATRDSLAIKGALSSATTKLHDVARAVPTSTSNVIGAPATVAIQEPHPHDGRRYFMAASSMPVQPESVSPSTKGGGLEMDQSYMTFAALDITVVNSVDAGGGSRARVVRTI